MLTRGEQTESRTGSGGRLHFGMVAGFKSESVAGLNRNSQCLSNVCFRELFGIVLDEIAAQESFVNEAIEIDLEADIVTVTRYALPNLDS